MRPPVPLKLIRVSETSTTVDPVADIWPYTSVPAKVGSKVGGLAITLPQFGKWQTCCFFLRMRIFIPLTQFGQVHATLLSLLQGWGDSLARGNVGTAIVVSLSALW